MGYLLSKFAITLSIAALRDQVVWIGDRGYDAGVRLVEIKCLNVRVKWYRWGWVG